MGREHKSKRQRKRKRGHHERETVLQKPHLDPLEVVVQSGVHVEAVRPVREAKAQVCRLPPLHHFDHKIPEENEIISIDQPFILTMTKHK